MNDPKIGLMKLIKLFLVLLSFRSDNDLHFTGILHGCYLRRKNCSFNKHCRENKSEP